MNSLQKKVCETLKNIFGDSVTVDFHDERGDGKHFYLDITSEKFIGLSKIEQSRLVYSALEEYLSNKDIHALRMKCRVPETL